MQLDNTRIAVRERSLLDICDLSLRVFRRYCGPLAVLFAAGALPMMLINHLLIGWLMDPGERESFFYLDDAGRIARFVWAMTVLIMIEAPLASVFATAYLGQAVFVDRPRLREMIISVLRMAPRVAWCQLLVRGVLPAWLLLLAVDRYSDDVNVGIEIVMLGGLATYVAALRLSRPFVNEIVLLERNPLVSRRPDALTVGRRSGRLHGPSTGDLIFRGLAVATLGTLLTLAVFGTFVFFGGVFLNRWKPGPLAIGLVFPLSMWIVAGYLMVVRFLCYLDLRIRHEGWEVELRVRAEAARLASRLV